MRREELYSYLADPDRLTPESLPAVTQLYEAYPYCGVFAFLYLYNLCIAEDVRYPSELRRLAPIVPDRERLFRLVEGRRPTADPAAVTEAEPDPFALIDTFLDGARSSGEALPDSLHLEGAPVANDYFAAEDQTEKERTLDELLPTLDMESKAAPAPSPASPSEGEDEEDGLLSESLSKIYIQQGHYDKALRIIRSLSLNYPEKSRFFADQIRFLERIIENNTIDK